MSLPVPPVCSVAAACDGLPSIGSSLTGGLAGSVFGALSSWVATGASWLVRHVVGLVGPGATVDLGAGWFVQREKAMTAIVLLVAGPLVTVATIGAIVHQDARRLVRIYAVGIPLGLVTGVAAVTLSDWALAVVDELCRMISPHGASAAYGRLAVKLANPGVPAFVQFAVAGVVILGAIALWLELVLRATAIYLAVFFFPLALASLLWPPAARIAKRFVEVLVALIGSKFVIVAALTLGASALATEKAGIDAAVTGAAVLLLAAFAPFALLRLLPLVEVATIGHLEGMARRPARAAAGAGRAASRLGSGPAAGLLDQLRSGESGGLSASPVASTGITERAGDYVVGPLDPGTAAGPDTSPPPPGAGSAAPVAALSASAPVGVPSASAPVAVPSASAPARPSRPDVPTLPPLAAGTYDPTPPSEEAGRHGR